MAHNIGKSEKAQMYLKAVRMVSLESPPVTVTKVAEFLGVSLPSVSEMLKRLEQQKAVKLDPEEGITLTLQGQKEADRLVRRMRLAECLLHQVLGLPLPQVYDEACKWEHTLSSAVEERIARVLGNPTACPHGYPIPVETGGIPEYGLSCRLLLTDLRPGDRGIITTLPERDAELLAYLCELGLLPQVEVEVEEVAPYNGPLFLRVGSAKRVVGREAADQVRVRPLGALPELIDLEALSGRT